MGEVLRSRKLTSSAERRTRDRRRARAGDLLHSAILGNLSSGVLIADPDGNVIESNAAAERILGLPGRRLTGLRCFGERWNAVRADGSAWPFDAQPVALTLRGGEECAGALMGIDRPDGKRVWVSLASFAVTLPRPYRAHGAAVCFLDVTAERESRLALAWSEQRFRDLTELSADWYWEQDERFRFVQMSRGAATHGGIEPGAFIGKCRWDLPWINMSAERWAAHRALLERHEAFRDLELQREDERGELQVISVSGKPVFDDAGRFAGYRGTGRNITERKRAERQLAQFVHYDGITGLPERVLLQDRLARAIERARREQALLAVVFLDLDQFKDVNEALGQAVGDEVLRAVAGRLRACLRGIDTVARLGGDEFTILLEGLRQRDEIPRVVQKLLDTVSAPLRVAQRDLLLSAGIGVSVYPLDDLAPDALLRNADLAMYHAKQEGRNNCRFYAPDMAARSEQRLELKARLRQGLERDEFVVHYQPQLDIASGRIVGVEALVRWMSADQGVMQPARFIGLAEETGLIIPIGERVLRAACRQMRAWQLRGCAPAVIAVNLSPRQFRQRNLARSIDAILRDAGLEPGALELELAEGTVMHRSGSAGSTLEELNALGVRLSIDDFGTGYSSLASLRRFPVHKLKVDQSFVRDIQARQDAAAIVGTALALARQLGLTAVAEGVETAAQLDFLRASGCDQYQGYLYSRPLSAEETGSLLARSLAAA